MRKKTILIILGVLVVLSLPIVFFVLTTATSSPKPIVIVAPKTTTTKESNSYVNSLLIDMSQKEKLTFTYVGQDQNKRSIDINANDKKKMEAMLQQVIDWAGNGQELKVLIQTGKEAYYNTFQTVIEALKAKGIYKYKLITTPA
jgi:biopolymer transport protein ExbD